MNEERATAADLQEAAAQAEVAESASKAFRNVNKTIEEGSLVEAL